jgi:hypothetical protein
MGSSLASKKASRGLMAIQTNLGVGGERGSLGTVGNESSRRVEQQTYAELERFLI